MGVVKKPAVAGPGWLPFDLLGNPVPPNKGLRGRNEHVPTAEKLELAIALYAERHSDKDVAAALGISEPTLRKHYFRHVRLKDARRNAAMLIKGRAVAKLHQLAFEEGKLGAVEKVLKRIDKSDQLALVERIKARPAAEAKVPALGKKEGALQNAAKAAGLFAKRTPPEALTH